MLKLNENMNENSNHSLAMKIKIAYICASKFTRKKSNKLMEYFTHLSESEMDLLTDSISYITILVAGADGNIDNKETEWATKLTKIRSYSSSEVLNPFYERVGSNFEERLDYLIDVLPKEVGSRNETISAELSKINAILPKLDDKLAYAMYDSLTTFAKHVAESSGGFFRFGSISKEEAALIDLPMLTPIEEPVEEDESEEE